MRLEINYFSSNFIPPAIDDKANVGTLNVTFSLEINKCLIAAMHDGIYRVSFIILSLSVKRPIIDKWSAFYQT